MGLEESTCRAVCPRVQDTTVRRALASIQQIFQIGFTVVIVRTSGSELYVCMNAVRLLQSVMRLANTG